MKMKKSLYYAFLVGLFLFFPKNAFSQILVTGKVFDDYDDVPLMGVTVMEDNTNNGTITDVGGQFSLTVKNQESQLAFSFIGKKKEVVRVGKLRIFNIVMQDDITELDEVVAIGYGSMKKSDLTGAVSSIKAKEIEDSKTTSFTSALAGKMAGVQAIQSGGDPGAGIEIKIRGASSVSAGSVPLYVIDGVMMINSESEMLGVDRHGGGSVDPLSSLNPNDIESIEVLKDASATAIYGSRGANGVVIITTKSGTSDGSVRVNFSSSLGFDFLPQKKIRALNGVDYEEYLRLRRPIQASSLSGSAELTSEVKKYWNDDFTPKATGVYTDWQDKLYQTGVTQSYNLSVRGSTRNTSSYSLSLGYFDKEGIIKTSNMNRLTFQSKISNTFNEYISFDLNLSGSIVKNDGVVSAHELNTSNIFIQMLSFRPNIREEDIDLNNDDTEDMGSNINNPVNNLMNIKQHSDARRTQGNFNVTITPHRNWTLKSMVGGYFTEAKGKNYYPSTTGPGRNYNGRVQHGTRRITNLLNDNILTYDKSFNRDHHVNAMGAVTIQRITNDELQIRTSDLMNENLGLENLKFGDNIEYPDNFYSYSSLLSYLGRVNYNLLNRYLFTVSYRADGSSKFSPGNKFSYYPSGAFAWKVNEEKFLKGVREIDQLKFRLSYGKTGNQNVGNLAALAMMSKQYYSFNTSQGNTGSPVQLSGFLPSSFGNSNLKWETTQQYNTGIDLMMWGGRVIFSGEVYYKYTTDLLIEEQLPAITGFVSVMRNVGSVENKGIELALSTTNYRNSKFTWTTDLNITLNRNKVLDIGSGDRIPITPSSIVQGHYDDIFYVREGYPIGAMFGYMTDGLYQLKDFKQFYTDANDPSTFITDPLIQQRIYDQTSKYTLMPGVVDRGDVVAPGYLKLKKLSNTNDGEINPKINDLEDKTYLGSAEPLFFGGITNRFSFLDFELSVFLQYSYGNKLFNANGGLLHGRGTFNLLNDYYHDMWKIDKQDRTQHFWDDNNGRILTTDMQAEDASYIKLKEVVLSYNVPKSIVKKIGARSIKFNLTGTNLFTLTNYSWYEPEYANRNPLMSALDRFAYPMSRSLTGGFVVVL